MDGLHALRIPEDQKKYIIEQLNPVLEEMVADCIHNAPPDPVPFMLSWLEAKVAQEENDLLSPNAVADLDNENRRLQESVNKARGQAQETAKLATIGSSKQDDDTDTDADSEDDEPPPGFFTDMRGGKARQSVSAEVYGQWNKKKDFLPPVVPKSEAERARLNECLMDSFLFSSLDAHDLSIVIKAMTEVKAEAGETVIHQGEDGDFLFVIQSGQLDCLIKGTDGAEKVVKTCRDREVVGELALLYNCPRAASVKSRDRSVLWRLDRETFNHIVKEAAQKRRNRYEEFLTRVPLLSSMDAYERSQLSDVLRTEIVTDGQVIVSQGETGNKFYIVETGSAKAVKNGQEVMSYGAGDYFGELALILDQPRAATVLAVGHAKLLSVDRAAFKRLLNVEELLQRSTKYT